MKFLATILPFLSASSVLAAAVSVSIEASASVVEELPPVQPTPVVAGADVPPADNSTLVDGEMELFAAPTRNYGASCRNYGIVNLTHFPRLYRAECRNRAGSWGRSDLSLPRCLANVNGRLVESNNGNYDQSCDPRSCRTSGTSITCNCKDYGGNWRSTTYNLNNVLANDNGVLRCYNHKGF